MRREFDTYAQKYQDLLNDPIRERFAKNQNFFHRRKLEVLLDLLKEDDVDPASQSWLDVGCGKGELLEMGRSRFALASGCDPSAEMLQPSGLGNVRVQEDLNRLPFEDASFDLVTAFASITTWNRRTGRPSATKSAGFSDRVAGFAFSSTILGIPLPESS